MADSEQSLYYSAFREEVSCGLHCGGENCRVWFLSEVDTWHACSCNSRKRVPHPEEGEFAPEAGEPVPPTAYEKLSPVERETFDAMDANDEIPF